jgi:tRNA pseudouridine38-40 synthase
VRTLQLTLEYDGTGYVGWQVQPNGPSIQAELERALSTLLQEQVRVTGAGRTDAGVHALGQVASLVTVKTIPLKAFVAGTNALMPKDIAVIAAAEREEGFDARRSARGKIYRYRIVNRACRAPLERRFAWEIFGPLDDAAMARAAQPLIGSHDFSAFRASDCEARTTVRELRRLQIRREGDRLELEIEATAFLKHMVRNIVGTLVQVGQGRRAEASVTEVLAKGDRTRAGPTAPPQGLCLLRVHYDSAASSPCG